MGGKYLSQALQGFLAIFIVRLVNDTGFTIMVATLGLILGHAFSPFLRFKERLTWPLLLGILTVFTPSVAVLVAVVGLGLFYIAGSFAVAQLTAGVLLPFLLWQVKNIDIYAIIGIIMAAILVYQAIPQLNPAQTANNKRLRIRQLLAILCILTISILLFFNRYVYRGFGMQVDIIRYGTEEFKVVAITFDDGPDPLSTPGILDILDEYNVPATFFMVDRHVEMHPEIAQRIVGEGHSIGNHTWSHRSLVPLGTDQTRFEIIRAHEAIESVTGQTPHLFRPPRGVYSAFAREYLRKQGYTMVLWNVSSQDWAEISANRIASNVLNTVRPGSIILLHDSGSLISPTGGNRINTVAALPVIIEELKDRGYTFLTMEEMIILTGLTGEQELD